MKLLKKDVLKWIKVLQSGSYKKGKSCLVSKSGTKFCCLGVWADMHGCTWDEVIIGGAVDGLIPVLKGKKSENNLEFKNRAYLKNPKIARGLDMGMQRKLAHANDKSTQGFKPVIALIKELVLPLAK